MKGLSMPEEIGMTLVMALAFIVMIVIAFILFIAIFFQGGGQASYSVKFLSDAEKPYMLANVLVRVQIGDRMLLEHAIEAASTGALNRSASYNVPSSLDTLMKSYRLRFYHISLDAPPDNIMDVSSVATRCGANAEGWCTLKKIGYTCDVGRVEIPSADCNSLQVCCKDDRQAYAALNRYDVVNCGSGICSEGIRLISTPYGLVPASGIPIPEVLTIEVCGRGQVDLPSAACDGTNNGKTPICCAPDTSQNRELAGITDARVPLLYKSFEGVLEVDGR